MIDPQIVPNQKLFKLVEFWATTTADASALTYEDRVISYGELNQQANQVAGLLQSRGLGRDTLIGLCMDRSIEFVVAVLGILKAGAAYVPLDPDYPTERLAFMLTDACIPLLFSHAHLVDRLPVGAHEVISLDPAWFATRSALKADWQPVEVAEDGLAYVIYTSGTTGRPKGVQITHQGLSQLIAGLVAVFSITPADRVLQFASMSFDASIAEIGMALGAGATLELAPRAALRPGPDLLHTLWQRNITTVVLPPSALAALPQEPLPALRCMIVAGEPCPAELVARWAPGREFYNAYGPTEGTVCATIMRCVPTGERPAIGYPLPHVSIYVLDSAMRPVQPGEIGTIYIGGAGLARGYLNQPDLTAQKFIPDPFTPGQRLYNTGDLGRHTVEGWLQFVGRVDQQVKLRGYRIELQEIEAVLEQHGNVRESAVIVHPHAALQQLIGYVSCAPGNGPVVQGPELRDFLRQTLPEYMVPAAIVVLDRFPLTPNGKIDRAALPLPDSSRPALGSAFTPLSTDLEHQIGAIWEELLNSEAPGADDHFFELGGHSLLSTQMIVRIQERLQIRLTLQSIFDHPILRDFAAHVEQQARQQPPPPAIVRLGDRTSFPLSFAQEQVWFINQLNGYTLAYHSQATLRFIGILDRTALDLSFSELIRRHEIFRTTFSTHDNQPTQIIHPAQPIQIPLIDLAGLTQDERDQMIAATISAEMRRPFELSKLPLIRPILLRLHAQEHLLVYIEHHLVHDGWSFSILLRELLAFYQAFCAGQPLRLPDLPVRYADYAVWQRQWIETDEARTQVRYWQQRLADVAHVLPLPTDHPRPATQSLRGAAVRIELASGLYESLKQLSHAAGATLFMTMLAGFQTLLYRYTDQSDISVGSGVANRRSSETEGLIGMLVNIVVLHTRLSSTMSFRELLAAVRTTTLSAYANQDLPFENVVAALQPARDLSYNPLFQVAFSFHDNPLPDLQLPDVTLEIEEALNNGSAKFDLNVVVIPRPEQYVGQDHGDRGITMIWEYSTDLFEEATIMRMAEHYQRLLAHIIDNPDQHLAHIPLLSASERECLLNTWNDTEQPFSMQQTLHQLIETQAEATPATPAVVFERQQLSYADLNRQADQLALLLHGAGVESQQPVGLYLDRSLQMVVGILGILKAGAIYVPIEPGYPAERIQAMLEDSQIAVILSSTPLATTLPAGNAHILCLDTLSSDEAEVVAKAAPMGDADALAYIIHTSGSTGRPKGVACTHAAVINLLEDVQARQPVGSGDQCSLWTNLSFDVAVYEIFAALTVGATLHIVPEHLRASGVMFTRWLAENSISSAYIPPFMIPDVAEHLREQRAPLALRRLLVGVEPMNELLLGEIAAGIPGLQLINGYGPTEATICATLYTLDPAAAHQRTTPIGRPVRNTQVYVLDPHMQPVPQGIPGELYIGGLGLAAGYWNHPELTSERFVANPFAVQMGTRLYRTGDRVRYLTDGNLEFLGRLDQQVKIRGYRIELGEIETVLKLHLAIKDALVDVRQDTTGSKCLIAYIIQQDTRSSTEVLRSFLRTRLPEYMIPTMIMDVEAFPVTSNGKINRAMLPDPLQASTDAERFYTGPRDSFEIQLQQIWARLFNLHPISVTDNFFELGGHSILAAHMMVHIEIELGQTLPLAVLFQQPTIEQLAAMLRAHHGAHATTSLVGIHTQGTQHPFFCVHSANGEVFSYIELARSIGDEYPVYGLQAAALYSTAQICNRMEDIAVRYISEMRQVQPEGPYYLGGWCTGGPIAFEISRQLEQQGQTVGLLALLDSHPRAKVPKFPHGVDDEATWMNLFFHDHLLIRDDELPRFEPSRLDEQWRYVKEWIKTENYWPPNVGIPYLKHQIGIFRAIMQAIYSYKPPIINQQMVVFLPEQHANVEDQTLGWSAYTTSGVSVEIVPGNHDTFIQSPNVQALAERLKIYFSKHDR